MGRQYPAGRTCLDCPAAISTQSKGRCRSCGARALAHDREMVARRTAATNASRHDPEIKERHAAGCARGKRRAMADPRELERMRRAGRRVAAFRQTPEQHAAAREAQRRQQLSWCPEHLWPLNAELRAKKLPLAERKAAILQLVPGTVEHAQREIANRELAARLRHERQLSEAY